MRVRVLNAIFLFAATDVSTRRMLLVDAILYTTSMSQLYIFLKAPVIPDKRIQLLKTVANITREIKKHFRLINNVFVTANNSIVIKPEKNMSMWSVTSIVWVIR